MKVCMHDKAFQGPELYRDTTRFAAAIAVAVPEIFFFKKKEGDCQQGIAVQKKADSTTNLAAMILFL